MVHESLLEDCVTPACLVNAPAGQQEYMTFTFEGVGPGCSTLRSQNDLHTPRLFGRYAQSKTCVLWVRDGLRLTIGRWPELMWCFPFWDGLDPGIFKAETRDYMADREAGGADDLERNILQYHGAERCRTHHNRCR